MRNSKIKPLVNSIAAEYETRSPFRIAKGMNIDIRYQELGRDLGYFCEFWGEKFIVVSESSPPEDRRFIVAHELGHAVLHPDIGTHQFNANSFLATCRVERQANLFAVELLLPDEAVDEFGDMGIYNVAHMFGIPEQLVELKEVNAK